MDTIGRKMVFEAMSLGEIVKEVKIEKDRRTTLLVCTLVSRIIDFCPLLAFKMLTQGAKF